MSIRVNLNVHPWLVETEIETELGIDPWEVLPRLMPPTQVEPGNVDPSLRAPAPTLQIGTPNMTITEMILQGREAYGIAPERESFMRGYFIAAMNMWFRDFMARFFPEDVGNLIASYWEAWVAGIESDRFVIESDLEYAGYVEAMRGVNWTKGGTVEAAASMASMELVDVINAFIAEAAMEALR